MATLQEQENETKLEALTKKMDKALEEIADLVSHTRGLIQEISFYQTTDTKADVRDATETARRVLGQFDNISKAAASRYKCEEIEEPEQLLNPFASKDDGYTLLETANRNIVLLVEKLNAFNPDTYVYHDLARSVIDDKLDQLKTFLENHEGEKTPDEQRQIDKMVPNLVRVSEQVWRDTRIESLEEWEEADTAKPSKLETEAIKRINALNVIIDSYNGEVPSRGKAAQRFEQQQQQHQPD